ncbi:MAG TPA: endonuclease III [Eubacteriaceae bacterium]|nr:endonuclease III [Eubacteriaceae bacterium]
MKQKKTVQKILSVFDQYYGKPEIMLNFRTPYELLVATVLSAQCTDVRVNKTTEVLYQEANTPQAMVALGEENLQPIIKSCGLSKTKAKNIVSLSEMLLKEYDGEVPMEHEQLVALPGVGRKTANVVVSNAFGIPAIAVDTHVFRVANRIGLANAKDVLGTEKDLMKAIPKDTWSDAHHWLIYHGRRICKARNPLCEECPIQKWCDYYKVPKKSRS